MCFETTDAATKSTLVLIKHQVNGIHHAPRFRGEQVILFVQTSIQMVQLEDNSIAESDEPLTRGLVKFPNQVTRWVIPARPRAS